MPKFITKKRVIITLISIFIAISACIIYLISIPFYKSYYYHGIINTAIKEFNENRKRCMLKEYSSGRSPLLTSGVSGYTERYKSACFDSDNKLYKELYIDFTWCPFSDLPGKYERRRNKGRDFKKSDFNFNCVFYEGRRSGICLYCYKGSTEYVIRAYPIPVTIYNRKQNEIREHLRELHELIWQQLDENSENR